MNTIAERKAIHLPPAKGFHQCCCHDDGWSDHYGAIHLAADYAGLIMPERYRIRAIWSHGCNGPWEQAMPGILYLNSPMGQQWPVLVSREEEVACLRTHGCPHARAIGLPIVYSAPSELAREPGSLLVMPTHTLVGDKYPDRAEFERYADEIAQLAPHFGRIVICIHPSCRKNDLWVPEFTQRGFEIVYGAQTNDLNALARMRALFEQVESVTTNGWGSHVAYALAFGARVSIHGTKPKSREENILRDTAWAANREGLEIARSAKLDSERRAFLKTFYVSPTEGVADVALGHWFIGEKNKLSPAAMRELLQAIVTPTPLTHEQRRAGFQRAREEAFKQARVLVQNGRAPEAIKALLRGAGADIASKDPRIIHDSLSQIAAEVAGLEPGLAANLRAEAEKVAVANGFNQTEAPSPAPTKVPPIPPSPALPPAPGPNEDLVGELNGLPWTRVEEIYTAARRELRARPEWRQGLDRVREAAKESFDGAKEYAPVIGQQFCDLGSGVYPPFGVSAVMYLNGAQSALGLELPRAESARAAEALADLLMECLAFPERWHWSAFAREKFVQRIRQFDLEALAAGRLEPGLAKVPLVSGITDIHSPKLAEASFDLMTSRAVLEHFLNFGGAVERLFALMRPGGVAAHHIDLVDHRAYAGPNHHYWSFLAEDESWTDGLVNRLRSCEIRPHFERVGFEILRYETQHGQLPPGFRSQVQGRFQRMSDEELSIVGVTCIVRRPAGGKAG